MLDIVATFEDQSDTLGYKFQYGTTPFQNYELTMNDLTQGESVVMMLPVVESALNIVHSSVINRLQSTITFLLARKFDPDDTTVSELDETYRQKYDRRLFALKQDAVSFINGILCAESIELTSFRMVEEINTYDENVDGVLCDLTVSYEIAD